jgi:hypothetical protein
VREHGVRECPSRNVIETAGGDRPVAARARAQRRHGGVHVLVAGTGAGQGRLRCLQTLARPALPDGDCKKRLKR